MKAEKIARIVEGVDLSAPIFMLGGDARDAFKQHSEVFRQVRSTDDLTAVNSIPHPYQLPECVEIGACRDAKSIEAPPDRAHDSPYRMLLHASPQNYPTSHR